MVNEIQAIKKILPLLKREPWALPVVSILGILASLFEGFGIGLFIPLLQSLEKGASSAGSSNIIIDSLSSLFTQVSPEIRLPFIALCIFVAIALKNVLAYANAVLLAWLGGQITHRLRLSVYQQLLDISPSYLDRTPQGKILNLIDVEIYRVNDALISLVDIITTACTVLVFGTILLSTNWKLTLLIFVLLLLLSWSFQSIKNKVSVISQQRSKATEKVTVRMLESLSGIKVIHSFTRESYEQERFAHASDDARLSYFKIYAYSRLIGPLSELISTGILAIILMLATTSLLQTQAASLPVLLTFIFILYRLQPQVKQLENARVGLVSYANSIHEVLSFTDRTDKPYISSGVVPFKRLEERIYFDDVTFRYAASEKPVFTNLSLSIPKGKTTALVGPSGAGKTTLIKLLSRFYEVTSGNIYVDDHPLTSLDTSSWRSKISVVTQDVFLFSTTIGENIAYGCPDATQAQVIEASKQANAHEFISQLPQGYDTQVGDRGMRLSGGQQQRIAIARAIVRDPEILILDEATSALDSVSERLIQEALERLKENRTVIVIAHRLSTIEDADQIVVLEQGKVIEQGNLSYLLGLKGLYAKFYDLQFRNSKN
jgi:ATP-binding cassette, subfamily B, bacterial MsbA